MTTSITLTEEAKAILEQFRHPSHDSWSETIEEVEKVAPTPSLLAEGCSRCGSVPALDRPISDVDAVYRRFVAEAAGVTHRSTLYYCSEECLNMDLEQAQQAVPEHPDAVVVGGKDKIRTSTTDSTFYLDGSSMEVNFTIPTAFDGYEREPVYVINAGGVVQEGVVGSILHEDHTTTLLLDQPDYENGEKSTAEFRPDDEEIEKVAPS